ncbi:GL14342 [Drosophila persimilis]|uniref:GL14342 n=1 Tax=Drosophila persimilis TaxID=7234 RepID=B4GQF4_DROPE|nr:GL14342 [Drosophila persimilis]
MPDIKDADIISCMEFNQDGRKNAEASAAEGSKHASTGGTCAHGAHLNDLPDREHRLVGSDTENTGDLAKPS